MPKGRSYMSSDAKFLLEASTCSLSGTRPRSRLVPIRSIKRRAAHHAFVFYKTQDLQMQKCVQKLHGAALRLQRKYFNSITIFPFSLPGIVLSRKKPRKPPTNMWVVSRMCNTWSTSLTPAEHTKITKDGKKHRCDKGETT